jgi:hypothetical protein
MVIHKYQKYTVFDKITKTRWFLGALVKLENTVRIIRYLFLAQRLGRESRSEPEAKTPSPNVHAMHYVSKARS